MTKDEQELVAEIAKLREDLRELREIVNVLVNVVMEDDMEEDEQDFTPFSGTDNKFNLYN
ncbi:MAG TPA: hypothetical protein HA364_03070 [Thermoplasmata archaeon]|nr:hypothetical protein [Thermoplasmata archaeon]